MTHRAFGAERNAKLRLIVRGILKDDFGGNQAKTADALGVSGPTLFNFLNNDRGAGMKLLDGIARYTRKTIDQLLGNPPTETFAPFSSLPGWAAADAEARRRYSHVPAAAFDAIGQWRGPQPPIPVNEVVVGELAEAFWKAMLLAPVAVEEPAPEESGKVRKIR